MEYAGTLQALQQASKILAHTSAKMRNHALVCLANELESSRAILQEENAKDIANARENGLSQAMIDRLRIDDSAITSMIQAVKEIKSQPEVLGEVISGGVRPSGITIAQVRIPLGVVCIIYESRPNVTIDTAALCIKSGNAILLKGGKEAHHSNTALLACIKRALDSSSLPKECVQSLGLIAREDLARILQQRAYIDVVIPRGGAGLIEFVTTHSKIPVIFHDKGVCHAYIDSSASKQHALDICLNAKASRPSACNAIECILIHRDSVGEILPDLVATLLANGVQVRAQAEVLALLGERDGLSLASASDFGVEFGDKIIALKIVESMQQALEHIDQYGSKHSEIIITQCLDSARKFCHYVDASAVFVNASSRFNDGGELGLGAEMGISTQKLHARGPMGAVHLTTTKYLIHGNGSIRI